MQTGHVPQGLVMGTCVYHIAHRGSAQTLGSAGQNVELPNFTQALYEARELAMTRMQDEASAARASGIVGVRLEEKSHQWGSHTIEFLSLGTAVTKTTGEVTLPKPTDHHLARQLMSRSPADLPEAAVRRFSSGAFTSGPHRARLRRLPAAGPGAGRLRPGLLRHAVAVGTAPARPSCGDRIRTPWRAQSDGAYSESYRCPHGFVRPSTGGGARTTSSRGSRTPGPPGYGAAYARMLEEATALGAHGVIGVVDRVTPLADSGDQSSSTSRARR